jgi:hypothetical protein
MAPAGFQIVIDERAKLVRQGLEDTGAAIPLIGRQGIYRTMKRISKRLQKPGAPIFYPVNWDTDRQRKAFFATEGFGRGIPTGRSGDYQQGWRIVEKLPRGYEMTNRAEGARFIGGDFEGQGQSRIHMERWPLVFEILNEEIGKLPDDVSAELRIYAAGHNLDIDNGFGRGGGFE